MNDNDSQNGDDNENEDGKKVSKATAEGRWRGREVRLVRCRFGGLERWFRFTGELGALRCTTVVLC